MTDKKYVAEELNNFAANIGKMGDIKDKNRQRQGDSFDREALRRFLGEYMESGLMASDFAALPPRARIEAVARLAAYVMPRLKAVDMDLGMKSECEEVHELSKSILSSVDEEVEES